VTDALVYAALRVVHVRARSVPTSSVVVQEKAQISIVDTPSDDTEVLTTQRNDELLAADAVIVVYDVNRLETLDRVKAYWLPHLRELKLATPVVLVGNKMDNRDGSPSSGVSSGMEAAIKPIMDAFPEVDVCIECSAKSVFNVWEVFLFALRAVLHPTGPLYNVATHDLKPAARMALTRIFHVCDLDSDGYMDDKELNTFQQQCFGVPLHEDELLGVKQVVRDGCPNGTGLNASNHLTVDGFVFLHHLFIQKGRLETTWTVLRKFGYEVSSSGSLELDKDVLVAGVPHKPEQGLELSAAAKDFLSTYFDGLPAAPRVPAATIRQSMESKNADAEPFDPRSPSPAYLPADGMYTKDAFLARCALLLLDDLPEFLVLITALGYTKTIATAVSVTPPRPRDRSSARAVTRETLTVFALGTPIQGISSLMRCLVGSSSGFSATPNGASSAVADAGDVLAKSSAAAYLQYKDDDSGDSGERLLVLRSVPLLAAKSITTSKRGLDLVDGVVLAYEASSAASVSEATQIFDHLRANSRAKLPVVFVSVRLPGTAADPAVEETARQYCTKAGVPLPSMVQLNASGGLTSDEATTKLFDNLLASVVSPASVCPGVFEADASETGSTAAKVGKVLLGSAAALALLYGAKKAYEWYTSNNTTEVQVAAV